MTRISPLKLARSGTALWLICCCLALPAALGTDNSTSDPAAILQLSSETAAAHPAASRRGIQGAAA
jgi:hypothetical protein